MAEEDRLNCDMAFSESKTFSLCPELAFSCDEDSISVMEKAPLEVLSNTKHP